MNLYETIKHMDIEEMSKCMAIIVYGALYASSGNSHLATLENIKSDPNYKKTVARAKTLLLEEYNG